MHKTRYLILIALIIAVIVSYFVVKQKRANDLFQERTKLANKLAESGVINAQDFVKWEFITDGVVKTGAISDNDLDWMLSIMHNPQTATNDPQIVHGDVLGTLMHLKQMTEEQRNKIYVAALPLLSSGKKLDKLYAARMMRKLGDKRAIPYLEPLLKDPDPDVQRLAHRALKDLSSSNINLPPSQF